MGFFKNKIFRVSLIFYYKRHGKTFTVQQIIIALKKKVKVNYNTVYVQSKL